MTWGSRGVVTTLLSPGDLWYSLDPSYLYRWTKNFTHFMISLLRTKMLFKNVCGDRFVRIKCEWESRRIHAMFFRPNLFNLRGIGVSYVYAV